MFILEDVENETVVMTVTTRADAFEGIVPKAQEVLETVDWEGVS